MGLLTLTQIPCHHVIANVIALNFKYCIGLKQIFNINLGIAIIKKTTFLFIFSTYLPVFLLKFQVGELFGCGIKFHIQRVPTLHNFHRPHYPKNKKYLKKCDDDVIITFFQVFLVFGVAGSIKSMQYIIITFFQVFLVFGVAGSIKIMQCWYSLDVELNSTSNELSCSEFE